MQGRDLAGDTLLVLVCADRKATSGTISLLRAFTSRRVFVPTSFTAFANSAGGTFEGFG